MEEAEKLLKERQTTFSKEICIEKYGKERGEVVWMERQRKWLASYTRNNYSKISQVLYTELWDRIKDDYSDVYFATLNESKEIVDDGKNNECRLKLNKSFILPDFFIPELKKIIEFDGTYYHRPTPENMKREYERDVNITNSGYEVLHISEADFKKDSEEVINRCLDFIYGRIGGNPTLEYPKIVKS